MNSKARAALILGVVVVVSGGVGYGLRSAFPPFPALTTPVVIDEPLWRAMISGPPAAGLLAVIAAVIAFFPAFLSTRVARRNASREMWWKRAEWAFDRVGSDSAAEREMANNVLLTLFDDATEDEAHLVYEAIARQQAEYVAVDTGSDSAEDGFWRRLTWPITRLTGK